MKRLLILLATVACLTSITHADYIDVVLGKNPIAYYPMDETAGTVMTDASSNGNNGTYNAVLTLGQVNAAPVGGAVNRSVQFTNADGASAAALPNNIAGTAAGSVSLWFNSTLAQIDTNASMLFYGVAGSTTGDGFGGQNELHVNLTLAGEVEMWMRGTGDNASSPRIRTSGIYADGAWHHVLATWDNTGNATALYLDGDAEVVNGLPGAIFSFSSLTRLGKAGTGGGANNRLYGGLMDEVALFDRALAPSDAVQLYSGIPEPSSLGLTVLGLGLLLSIRSRRPSA